MTSLTKLETSLICVIIFILMGVGFAFYFEHRGAENCVNAQAAVVTQAESHNTEVETGAKVANAKTEAHYDDMLHSPIGALPSTAGLQPPACPSPMPGPGRAAAPRPGPAPVRAEPPPSVVQPKWDSFERSDVQGAHDADAEVSYLQELLATQYAVCMGKVAR